MSLKNDFLIFQNNPDLIYLDSASTAQKPRAVIDEIARFLSQDYANIHRGAYVLSERSEELYRASKEAVRKLIHATEVSEVSYAYNATHAFNILSLSIQKSGWLKKWDKILLSLAEHHANVVPWLLLKESIWVEVEFVRLDVDYVLDFEDFARKLTPNTRIVSFTAASNVTGGVFDLARVRDLIRIRVPEALFVIDGSQAVPHFQIDVQTLDIDFLIFTGHKIMSDTGIGVLYGKKQHLKSLTPALGGGGAINWVHEDAFAPAGLPYRFEPGTPHIVGAASLLASLRYIDSIGGYTRIEEIEQDLVMYTLSLWQDFKKEFPQVRLIGSEKGENRIGVFSFTVEGMHFSDIADAFAEEWICVRAGHHCAEPFMHDCGIAGSVRMSLFLYNTREDMERFFEVLGRILQA